MMSARVRESRREALLRAASVPSTGSGWGWLAAALRALAGLSPSGVRP